MIFMILTSADMERTNEIGFLAYLQKFRDLGSDVGDEYDCLEGCAMIHKTQHPVYRTAQYGYQYCLVQ